MKMNVVCSDLAKGCEKQYSTAKVYGFGKLSGSLRGKARAKIIAPQMPGALSLR